MVPPKFSAGRAPFVAPLARGTGRGRLRPRSAAVFASSLPWDASSLRRPSLSGGVVGTCAASTQCPQLYQFKGKCQEPGKQRARAGAFPRSCFPGAAAPDPAASRAAYRSHPPDGQCSLLPPFRLSPAGPRCWARPGTPNVCTFLASPRKVPKRRREKGDTPFSNPRVCQGCIQFNSGARKMHTLAPQHPLPLPGRISWIGRVHKERLARGSAESLM